MKLSSAWRNWVGAGLSSIVLTTLFSCGFRIDKNPSTDSSNPPPVSAPTDLSNHRVLGYNSLKAQIFTPRCIACHGSKGGVNLESFAAISPLISRIEREVLVEKKMPPSGPLSDADQTLIRIWIDAGAPENDIDLPAQPGPTHSITPDPTPSPQPSVSPTPVPSGIPVKVTYADVQVQIFKNQCLHCHDATTGHPKHKVSVNTYADVMSFITQIQDQALVQKAMPPDAPLSDSDQKLLQAWIDQGEQQ